MKTYTIAHGQTLCFTQELIQGYIVRIRQVSDNDCIVEKSPATECADVESSEGWEPVDDDGLCAQMYMQAMLNLRRWIEKGSIR